MNNPFVQWAGFVVGSIALMVSVFNLFLTHRRNSRDATFKMLDRWMADGMRTARHSVITAIRERDSSQVGNRVSLIEEQILRDRMFEARTRRLEEIIRDGEPEIIKQYSVEDREELKRACEFDSHFRPPIFEIARQYERYTGYIVNELDIQMASDKNKYKMWYIKTIDDIFNIQRGELTTEENRYAWAEAWRYYIDSEYYLIDVYQDELRAELLANAQVTAELKALFDANVLDRKLVRRYLLNLCPNGLRLQNGFTTPLIRLKTLG